MWLYISYQLFYRILFLFNYRQTLLKLNLETNQIQAEGFEHIAKALEKNKVYFTLIQYFFWYLITDLDYPGSCKQ